MIRLPFVLVFMGLVCASPVARAYEPFVPSTGYESSYPAAVPVYPAIPQGYDYSRPPSTLDSQPKVTNCVQTTYGYRCTSF
jgi:hypothetical protein